MGLIWLFPAWAERTIGSTRPRDVRAWFLARGLDIPRQTWRKFLASHPPASCVYASWVEICEAAQEPLESFVQIRPSGRKPKPRLQGRKPRPRKPTPKPKPTGPALPPRPSAFYRGLGNG